MGQYSQADRKFRVDTPLGEDVLLLERFEGEEGVSTPFRFTLHMVSEDPALDATALLRQPVCVSVELQDGGTRVIHGLMRRFEQLGRAAGDGLVNYRAEVVPWLWFLSLSSDCRIFQNMKVPEIVEQVFRDMGFADFTFRLVGGSQPREYCVQYRETHLAFVARLLEEEGIFYFFEHAADRHTLILADAPSAVKPCPGQPRARLVPQAGPEMAEDVVVGVAVERSAHTGKVALGDYNYLTPSASLAASVGAEAEEHYDYPGRYAVRDDGDRYARVALEVREARGELLHGSGTCRAFQAGFRFGLEEHYRGDLNKQWQLLRVVHEGTSGGFGTGRGADDADYSNSFTCIPHSVPFRPPPTVPRPVVPGSQTAIVVGKPGEEIWTDKHGRVKVQFHWDRRGTRDDRSSCWVRVAQPWAGKGWGSLAIPRVGQEVVVEFLEGDPDQPLVVGSVYNADQAPPYDPASGGVVSGLRSKTHKGSGYNEMSMDDTPGKERITIHAQYDMDTVVEHDETKTVKSGTQTVTVKGDTSLTVQAGSRTVSVTGGDYDASASAAVKLHGQGAGVQVTGDAAGVTITGTGGTGVTVSGSPNVEIDGAAETYIVAPSTTVEGTTECALTGPNVYVDGKTQIAVTSPNIDVGDGTIVIHGSSITLEAGGGSITIDGSGVTITGSKITSAASGQHVVMGAIVQIN